MIDQKKNSKIRLWINLVILILLSAYIFKQVFFKEKISYIPEYEYVGKEACISCHKAAYNDWIGSDHDKAMDLATDSTVLGDFNNIIYHRNGKNHRCYKKDNKFMVYTDGEDGTMQNYEVKYVFGYDPLQNYLVEFPGGRLQTLALTWNSLDSNWFYMSDSVYSEHSVTHENWYHWTNQGQNWNSMCAYCHSTNLIKGYDPVSNTYNTSWSEIDVSCEACHGPSSYHIEWADMPTYEQNKIENYGLVEKTSGINNVEYVEICARCHSRRSNMNDYDYRASSIYDHIIPNLPIEPSYYIDGQIKEEDYVYGSFAQTKMFMNDVKCNDCHNVHSGQLILENNKLCTQCHVAAIYDSKSHHFHKDFGEKGTAVISESGVEFEVGSGTQCIQCHMHAQYFMGVDYRSDHSFRIPRPDLSEKLGTPNACNQCHSKESNKWSEEKIKNWYGISRHFQFGEAIYSASKFEENADAQIIEIISDEVYPPSIRMAALSYLNFNIDSNKSILYSQLQNIEPLFRYTAVNNLLIQSQEDINKLLPLLNDEVKTVRVEIANKLAFISLEQIPEKYHEKFLQVLNEYEEVLLYNSDFPIGKYNLGNFYYFRKKYELAEKFYLAAMAQDPELDFVMMNISHLYSLINKPEKAEHYLEIYSTKNPNDPSANYNYGLILSENRKYKQSLVYLIKASNLMPHNPRVDINIALLYEYFGDFVNQERYLKIAINKDVSQIENHIYLLNFYIKQNNTAKIQSKAKQIIELFPDSKEARNIKTQLQL